MPPGLLTPGDRVNARGRRVRLELGRRVLDVGLADQPADLTVECITHRFTPGSKATLTDWYPRTKLEMDESRRSTKRGKFGAVKHVYPKDVMGELRGWFTDAIAERLPTARLLYWT